MFVFIDFLFLLVLAGAAVLVLEKVEEEIIEEWEKEQRERMFNISLLEQEEIDTDKSGEEITNETY